MKRLPCQITYTLIFLLSINISHTKCFTTTADSTHNQTCIGQGFSTFNHKMVPQTALENRFHIRDTNPSYIMQFSGYLSKEYQEEDFDLSLSFGFSALEHQIKAILDAVISKRSDKQSLSVIYTCKKQYELEMYSDDMPLTMKQTALKLYHDNPMQFLNAYGDRYISKANIGGKLYLVINFSFSSSENKRKFADSLSIGIPDMIDLAGSFNKTFNENRIQGTVQILIYQLGGDPGSLASEHKSMTFSFDDLKSFEHQLQSLFDYVTLFEQQIDPEKPSTYIVFDKVTTESYSTLTNVNNMLEENNNYFPHKTLKSRKNIANTFFRFNQIDKNAITMMRNTLEKNKFWMLDEVSQRIEHSLNLYHTLDMYFTNNSPDTPLFYCYQPGSENTYCPMADNQLNALIATSGIKNLDALVSTINDFSYSININDMLFAFPISPKIPLANSRLGPERITTQANDSVILGPADIVQEFIIHDASHSAVSEGYLIAKKTDLDTIDTINTQGLNTLLISRHSKINQADKHIRSYWLFNQEDHAIPIIPKHYLPDVFSIQNAFIENPELSGVSFVKSGEHSVSTNYQSLFEFVLNDAAIKAAARPFTFCYRNSAHFGYLINKRTGESDKRSHWKKVCINARPGDILDFHSYSIHKSSIPSNRYYIFSRDNIDNHFDYTDDKGTQIKSINIGQKLN